jgi:hypothetical protein
LQPLFPSSYFAPAAYFFELVKYKDVIIDVHEHFPKQTWRNRCSIYSPNGVQHLIVPIHNRKDKTPLNEIKISYAERWQTNHWRSIEAAYRKSPFFEYYEFDLKPIFENKFEYLSQLNNAALSSILQLTELTISKEESKAYNPNPEKDYRPILAKVQLREHNKNCKRYQQAFEERHGFLPNLSCLDVLFNLGPKSKEYFLTLDT